jgi:hypothetical protein
MRARGGEEEGELFDFGLWLSMESFVNLRAGVTIGHKGLG